MEIRQLIQLKQNGTSNRRCAELLQINRNTVNDYVRVLQAVGKSYSELLLKTDLEIQELFPLADTKDPLRYKILLEYLAKV